MNIEAQQKLWHSYKKVCYSQQIIMDMILLRKQFAS